MTMSARSIPVFIPRSLTPDLRSKVRRLSVSPDAMIAAAQVAVTGLQSAFEKWLPDDIENMKQLVVVLRTDGPDRDKTRGMLARTAHNCKGQGKTFGYDLVTAIAGLLHQFLTEVPVERQRIHIICAHVEALDAISRNRITGDGGKTGADLVATLVDAVAIQTTQEEHKT